ncbi:hypothetical protein L209DRAFT_711026 [Thermothelomyces heterothallicus CBS 203.75]
MRASSSDFASTTAFEYAINHVFLPPRTPQKDDTNIIEEHGLIESLLVSTNELSRICERSESHQLGPITRMLKRLLSVEPGMDSATKRKTMKEVISELQDGEYAVFHIRAQNAGLLLTGRQNDILVEAFELLAPNKDVMTCPGRLIREFPDCAASVNRTVMFDGDFLDDFVDVLRQLELQESPLAHQKTRKSGRKFDEERDTDSPFLVTDMVMGTLAGLGRSVEPQRIVKRSREQVNWDSAFLAFHRSPTWLLLRVATRLVLDRNAARDRHESLYKTLITFHHGLLLQQATQHELGSDLRFTMAAKLCRRLAKLDPRHNVPWVQELSEIIAENAGALQHRWEEAQTGCNAGNFSPASLEQLCFEADTNLQLQTSLGPHLSWIQTRSLDDQSAAGPGDNTWFSIFPASKFPSFPAFEEEEKYSLLELESWIESNLSSWVTRCLCDFHHTSNNSSSLSSTKVGVKLRKLKNLIIDYYIEGKEAYKGNPEALSLMYLNLMSLWVATDKIAGAAAPLLLEFDPGFPPDLLQPLLLPTRLEMARLHEIETYLSRRRKEARNGYPQVFAHFGTPKSFAVRYFDSSAEQKELLSHIQAESERAAARKQQQYRDMRRTWEALTRELGSSSHQTVWNRKMKSEVCKSNCNACWLGSRIKALRIDLFEWPLPSGDVNLAKAIVFEISVPEVVAIWRDVTTKLLCEVFRTGGTLGTVGNLWSASAHPGLARFVTATSRVQVASTIKPVAASHYRGKHISGITDPEDVVVRPLWQHYDYYEPTSRIPHFEMFKNLSLPAQCSFAEHQSGRLLRSWTRSTGHTSNEVIAAQSQCPPDMSLDEFRAFGHLRSGHRLQWANVLCQLRVPSLNWNHESTYWLVLQACLEAGPPDHSDCLRRESHADLGNDVLVRRMTEALDTALDRYRENWQNNVAVSLLACLGTRVLSLTSENYKNSDDEDDKEDNDKDSKGKKETESMIGNKEHKEPAPPSLIDSLLAFLSRVREATICWARQLLERRASCILEDEQKSLDKRILMAALTCMSTFDLETNLLQVILQSTNFLSIFVEATILAHDYTPPTESVSDPILLMLLHRWRRTMHRSREIIMTEVVTNANIGFHRAIHRFWADYPPSTRQWSTLPGKKSHILRTVMGTGNDKAIDITFNSLDGRLLVAGYPLSRLPREYTSTPAYKELFGSKVLEVMPSTRQGMCFSACRPQHGWVVHFTMVRADLVIQAVQAEDISSTKPDAGARVCEFIPSEKLKGDVPASFVRNYSHWLDLATGVIEFRPRDQPWESSEDSWTLTRDGSSNILSHGGCYVLDPHSPTAEALFARLKPIETREHLDMIFHPDDHVLVVDLPRFSISFSLAEGGAVIRSKHYSGMCIDDDQNIGTLFGLENKLVLRQEENDSEHCSPRRIVLVPRGSPTAEIASNHVSVRVNVPAGLRVKHDAFTIDTTLGRIASSTSLASKLYLCYLHALTSHCLPDPLTGRTGTEEALRILRSASVRSFQRLDLESYHLLCDIARISPRRLFYPEHLTVMERITWSGKLPVLSQNDALWTEVEDILSHARDCALLHLQDEEGSDSFKIESVEGSSRLLLDRAKIRNATFQVSEFGAEMHTTTFDDRYSGRHLNRGPEAHSRVKMVTSRLLSGRQELLDPLPSTLREDLLAVIGQQFPGHSEVDLRFQLDYLQPAPKSLSKLWCGLHRKLTEEPNKYRIAFFLSALIYAEKSDWAVVQALMALAIAPSRFQVLVTPPREQRFDLDYDLSTLRHGIDQIIRNSQYDFDLCPETNLARLDFESDNQVEKRRYCIWKENSEKMARSFRTELELQWCQGWTVATPTGKMYSSYLDVDTIMSKVSDALDLARRTSLFEQYLFDLGRELRDMRVSPGQETDQNGFSSDDSAAIPSLEPQHAGRSAYVSSDVLFSRSAPSTSRPRLVDFTYLCGRAVHAAGDRGPLAGLFEHLSRIAGDRPYQTDYLKELESSSVSTARPALQLKQCIDDLRSIFEVHLCECKQTVEEIRGAIEETLSPRSIVDATLQTAGLYPRISPIFLLRRLTRDFWADLSEGWRECLANYALSLSYLQRAQRLVNASSDPSKRTELLREIQTTGTHESDDGNPLVFPENLLLELEQGILIRPVQQSIAAKMRDPPGGRNSVMQLNMGEGKSSVIVPVVAASLADGERLVRVVVAKPQSKQMQHSLIGTLGGLINRRVFYLPFSRALQIQSDGLVVIRRMLETCRKERGVLLVQPEHLLSFKLMGLESIYAQPGSIGQEILQTYREFEAVSRDIVDESDENFSVKFELIYTMGAQQPIDMSPERWTTIQELMDIVLDVSKELTSGPGRIRGLLLEEHDNTAGSRFPTIRVLEDSAGKVLVETVAERICRIGLKGFPIHHQTKRMRQAVLEYILQPSLTPEQIAAVEDAESGLFSEPTSRNALLLLRGLLAFNVILFALGQKRFRVNYGLAPDRRPATMLAVPYRAKDSPAPRSEFSHPDVVIVLTCLSYYYQGLSSKQLRSCLEILGKSDQAEQEYSRWAAKSPDLPSSLGHFSGVNLQDGTLYKESIFPALRYTKPAIDFFLSTAVFPREMREFPFKLSASGWDLGKTKRDPLTGFSGTTDSKYVLPLSVTALDLEEQRHTNSAVLACLLRDENTVLELGGDEAGVSALTVDVLLNAVTTSRQPMRVILDVGAQIIELSNLQVAQRWLGLVPEQDADAVIFFNDHDELSVLTRDGSVDLFITSPFATQTDRCLVFLDQAHTRGTDLRLPDSYRAAVTLGPNLTKDMLVQACMRMRKLGAGQSVTFCVSPEMQKRVRSLAHLEDPRPLTVTDILVCAIVETWDDAYRSLPVWATQGLRHQHQELVWERAEDTGELSINDVVDYMEDEAQSLEQRYRPISDGSGTNSQGLTAKLIEASKLEARQGQVRQIRAKCLSFGLANLDAMGSLQEEQERELAPEVERERQVERPPPRSPAAHELHPDVKLFATSGILITNSPAFRPAFHTLASTSAAKHFPVERFPSDLLATADFARTLQAGEDAKDTELSSFDAYQRPVQWLLTTNPTALPSDKQALQASRRQKKKKKTKAASTPRYGMHMVLVSSWEANVLKKVLEADAAAAAAAAAAIAVGTPAGAPPVLLRAYLPRTSLSFESLEDLTAYTVPAHAATTTTTPKELITQLNLFAGQLYLRTYDDYVRLCRYLGLSYRENEGDTDIAADGFVGRGGGGGSGGGKGGEYEACEFEQSPIGFLGVLFRRIRRDCLDIEKAHMGRVLSGEILTEKDFEESGSDTKLNGHIRSESGV